MDRGGVRSKLGCAKPFLAFLLAGGGLAEVGLPSRQGGVYGGEGGAGDFGVWPDFDVLEDGAVHEAALEFVALGVDLVGFVDAAEGEIEGFLDVL